jgi:DNA modification methylase
MSFQNKKDSKIEIPDRGIYDSRNKLNNLTGSEWLFFQNSVLITGYSTVSEENIGHKIRKIHPSPKPPQLMCDIVRFFTKDDGVIFDPFAGVGGTMLGVALAEGKRKAIGIELSKDYITAYQQVCKEYELDEFPIICGDARHMLQHEEVSETMFDLILTDPPYADMLTRDQNGSKRKLYNSNEPTPFTESPLDIGNLPHDEFLQALKEIIEKAVTRLKQGKYLVVFCKDMQPNSQTGELNLLHADVAKIISQIPELSFVGMKIWHDQANRLFPFGYPYKLVLNQMHQYILIFHKDL